METLRLPAHIADAKACSDINRRVAAGTLRLDWADLRTFDRAALVTLLEGMTLDALPDGFNVDSVPETLVDIIQIVLSANAARPKRRPARKVKASGEAPAVWRSPSEPPSVREPAAPRRVSSAPPRPPVLAADVPAPARLREELEARVLAELLGPVGGDSEEVDDPRLRPRDRYLVGVIAPRRLRIKREEVDTLGAGADEETDDGGDEDEGLSADTMFPSAIGISFCVAPGTKLAVTATWGRYKRAQSATRKSCPWCGTAIEAARDVTVYGFARGPGRTLTFCGDQRGTCLFSRRNSDGEGLPVVVVDEEIYRLLPSLLISTVDKFAQMPWNPQVQMLFGQVNGRCTRHGFRSPGTRDTDSHPKVDRLPAAKTVHQGPLRPPDLIVQDELHLISGPLGTLTGLYETAVDELCTWEVNGKRVRPKVVASTATIRRAKEQVHALFARRLAVFPPPGLDSEDNFFAVQRSTEDVPGRVYLGICAPGRRLKASLIRVYVAFLGAAQSLYLRYGRHADPWMTLVGYFGSLRELAGMRRLVDDDVKNRMFRMNRTGLADRRLGEPKELTSRLGATEIPALLDLLEVPFEPADAERDKEERRKLKKPIDVLLATNMISVGVDVQRLGLMVCAGQPKTTAEYIQATSRVGRRHPGIVCTVYNWARPRDLSHYETFEHYHATFYEHVEALSVTPFASRALDRGLSALLVSLVRLQGPELNANEAAAAFDPSNPAVKRAIETIARRAEAVEESKALGVDVRKALGARVQDWSARAKPKPGLGKLGYRTAKDGETRGLLAAAGADEWETFTCLNSLRDVEAPVTLLFDEGRMDDEPVTLAPEGTTP